MYFGLAYSDASLCSAFIPLLRVHIYGQTQDEQGGDSQNFLRKFVRFFVTLGLKILRLLRLKVLFEADIIKGQC